MSKTVCGQCQQDITGIDHRGACPGVAISWKRIRHCGTSGKVSYSKVHAYKLITPSIALCNLLLTLSRSTDEVEVYDRAFQHDSICALCSIHIGALAAMNSQQSPKPQYPAFEKLVQELHRNGLSDLAWHLEVYLRTATPQQCNALYNSIVNYEFSTRNTIGGRRI